MKYELYQNLGPLRSILRAPEHKMLGGGTMCPPPLQSRVKVLSWNFIRKWLSICLHHGESLKVKVCKSNTWDCSDFSCWTNLNVKYYIPHQQRWRSTVSNNLNIRNNIITNAKREISKLNIELFVVNITTEWQMLWLSMVVSHQCSRVTPLLTIDIIEN